jgi:CO/xanthine dehydrogenase Mo-binding subunit
MRLGPSDMRALAVCATEAEGVDSRAFSDGLMPGAAPSGFGAAGDTYPGAASRRETVAELEGFEARKVESAAFGYLRGIGLCLCPTPGSDPASEYESVGGYLAEAEVCPITGRVRLVAHMKSADFGGLMLPRSLHASGADPLRAVHDESGLLLTASLMDYEGMSLEDEGRPRIALEAGFAVDETLDVGGYGRQGAIAMRMAVANAVLDALWARGVRMVTMPLTPEKVRGWLNGSVEGAPI